MKYLQVFPAAHGWFAFWIKPFNARVVMWALREDGKLVGIVAGEDGLEEAENHGDLRYEWLGK
jgi:hypothetical protein